MSIVKERLGIPQVSRSLLRIRYMRAAVWIPQVSGAIGIDLCCEMETYGRQKLFYNSMLEALSNTNTNF
ncbi:hypothetical protein DPMN_028153 [Dreissena polymorpha]|uniref:Uncharacterized protein n=1 Tax=Dreissena polymorpha TaxID=45954 RepID=A0A9D4LWG7_DREPO|nr:hypothetical protein DPMN_028153 [Dreissena polymorpha]